MQQKIVAQSFIDNESHCFGRLLVVIRTNKICHHQHWLDCIVRWQSLPSSRRLIYSWAQLIRVHPVNITPHRHPHPQTVPKFIEPLFLHQLMQNLKPAAKFIQFIVENIFRILATTADVLKQFLACSCIAYIHHKFGRSCQVCTWIYECFTSTFANAYVSVRSVAPDARMRLWLNRFLFVVGASYANFCSHQH